MATALLITNPAAARTEPLAVNVVLDALRAAGWRTEVLATGGPGDARRLAEYGVREAVDLVAVFGGDGTTMQAAAALVGTDVALGLVPGGTGNLLAGNLRIPASPARAAEVLVRGRIQASGGPELAQELELLRAGQRRDLTPVPKSTAVVVWQPRKGPR